MPAPFAADTSPFDDTHQPSDALDGAGYRNPFGQQQQLLPQVMEADTALTRHQLDAIDALRQYKSLRRRDAVEGFAGFKQALQSSRDAVQQDLSPQAKALLKPHLDSTYIDSLQVGQDHQLRQDHAWSDQSSLDSMQANLQEALLHRDDANKVQQMADHSSGEWLKIGERKGWSDQLIGQQAMQTKAQLFGQVIQAQLQDGRPDQAQATVNQVKGQLDGRTLEQLMNNIHPYNEQPPNPSQNPSPGTAADAPSSGLGVQGGPNVQGGLGAQQYPPHSGQHATKPDIDPNLPQTTGNAPEGRVAAVDSSIEDSSDPKAGLDPHTRLLPRQWRNYLIPAEKSIGALDQPLDLLKGIKPSGKGCEVANGMMTCTTPAGRTFTIPAPPGFQSFLPGDKDYHSYSYGIGPSGLPSDQLMRGVTNAPTPGPSDDVKPATPGGVLNEAQPDWQVSILKAQGGDNGVTGEPVDSNNPIYFSPVKTYLTTDQDGNPMVINVTEPGHPLFPGYVARYIVRPDSGFYIANEGEGSGSYQAGAIAEQYINGIWKGQSRDIINRLKPDSPGYHQGPPK